MIGGTILLLVASQFYGGTALIDARGWRLRSAAHFAERHGLIIIIALGESIVAIGVGVTDLPISTPILIASMLGLAVAAALWWIYFDYTVIFGEQALAAEPEETRPTLARDAYTFLHFPMVAGVVLYLLGHVGFKWRTTHDLSVSRLVTAAAAVVAVPLIGKVPREQPLPPSRPRWWQGMIARVRR
jgi:low temperature requirement protein LtrA